MSTQALLLIPAKKNIIDGSYTGIYLWTDGGTISAKFMNKHFSEEGDVRRLMKMGDIYAVKTLRDACDCEQGMNAADDPHKWVPFNGTMLLYREAVAGNARNYASIKEACAHSVDYVFVYSPATKEWTKLKAASALKKWSANGVSYSGTYYLDRDTVDTISDLTSHSPKDESECFGEEQTLIFTAYFANGYSMDCKLCGVDYEEGSDNLPYTEAVLYDQHESQVAYSDADDFALGIGEVWSLTDNDGNTYSVTFATNDPAKYVPAPHSLEDTMKECAAKMAAKGHSEGFVPSL